MSYKELGITIIQQFTGTSTAITNPILPLYVVGPGYNVQFLATNSPVDAYSGSSKDVDYPSLGSNEYVDQGTSDTWETNELEYPVEVYVVDGKKVIDSFATGYFGGTRHYAVGAKGLASTTLSGFPTGTFSPTDVGKSIYVHSGTAADRGLRTISTVNAPGDSVTLTGANFTVVETVNSSIIPTSGVVQRFYSSAKLDDARILDKLEMGAGFATSYTISAVDATTSSYVDVTQGVAPTGDDNPWRVTAILDSIAVSATQNINAVKLVRDTDFTVLRDKLSLVSGIQDTNTPTGPIVSGTIKVNYRSVKTGLVNQTGYIEASTQIATKIGITSEYNPLAMALSKARENTTSKIYFSGMDVIAGVKSGLYEFDSMAKLGFGDSLTRIADEDASVLVGLTQNAGHNSLMSTHARDVSDPTKDWNRVRIVVINTSLIVESIIDAKDTAVAWDINGVTEVAASDDAEFNDKSNRLWSRGVVKFPDFDGTVSPLPVDYSTDLVKASGSTLTNDGFWGVNNSEHLKIKDPGVLLEVSPNRGYVAAYGNRIRSCTFGLTASDSGSALAGTLDTIRLTGPAGTFRYLASEGVAPVGLKCIAWLPTLMDGVISSNAMSTEISALNVTDYSSIDVDIAYDTVVPPVAYTTPNMSQVSVIGYDDVFATPGVTASRLNRSIAGTVALTAATDLVDSGVPGTFTGLVGAQVLVSGSATPADNKSHTIVTAPGDGSTCTVASITVNDATASCSVSVVKLTGAAGAGEFNGVTTVMVSNTLSYSGRGNALVGVKDVGAKTLSGFAAGTFGFGDIGRELRFIDDVTGAIDVQEITAIDSDIKVTLGNLLVVWPAGANAVSASIADQDYVSETFLIAELDASHNYIITNKDWGQKFAGTNLCSVAIAGFGTIGFGDAGRTVRILTGTYAGQSYTVQSVKQEELILTNTTAFGAVATQGVSSTAEDLGGFEMEFSSTPGNNTFSLEDKTLTPMVSESSIDYSVQRDFRELTVTGETFVTKGFIAGDVIRVTSPTAIAGDYVIDTVVSEEIVKTVVGDEFSMTGLTAIFTGVLSSLIYTLVKPKTKDEQAEAIRDYAASFADRRTTLVWPDQSVFDVAGASVTAPGYYWGVAVGAFVAGLAPQQGLSKLGFTGFTSAPHGKSDNYFTRAQLNTIAGGGVMIIHQDDSGDTPHIRHQLTTDISSIKKQELSITKIIDYVTRVIRQEFSVWIGKYNISDELLSQLRTTASAVVTFCEEFSDVRAGKLVNEMRLEKLDVSETEIDQTEHQWYVDAPVPHNRMLMTVRT